VTESSWLDDEGAGGCLYGKHICLIWAAIFFTGLGFSRADQIVLDGIVGVGEIPHNFLLEIFVEFWIVRF